MATTTATKVKIETNWQSKKRTERLEFRCSPNFMLIVEALIAKFGKGRDYSKADLMVLAVKELAKKENILLVGDEYYV